MLCKCHVKMALGPRQVAFTVTFTEWTRQGKLEMKVFYCILYKTCPKAQTPLGEFTFEFREMAEKRLK